MPEAKAVSCTEMLFAGRPRGLTSPQPLLALPEGPADGPVQGSEAQQCGPLVGM